jgi:8-oxo-dGTP pyrophosphatase MutT (NUDIX family)
VLLLGARDPDDGRSVWYCPGGGVEPGESLTDAIRRELREELGLTSDLDLTGPVWKRSHEFTWDGRAIDQLEWFFVARLQVPLAAEEVRPEGTEGEYFVGARWLQIEEIRRWPELVAPRRLATLLEPLLSGHVPIQPIDTGI